MMGGTCLGGIGGVGPALAFLGSVGLAGVAALLYAARQSGRAAPAETVGGAPSDTARAILRERFARGEIDRAEYEERRTALSGAGPHWP